MSHATRAASKWLACANDGTVDDSGRYRVPTRNRQAGGFFGNKTQQGTAASTLQTNSESDAPWRRTATQFMIGIVQMIGIPGGESTTTCRRPTRRPGQVFRSVVAWPALLALLAQMCLSPAIAQTTYGEEAATRLQLASRTEPLTDDAAFGEKIGLFNGTTSFRYVDVSLPSNNSLPVEFARIEGGEYNPNFWAWDVDVPKITSVMPVNWTDGWTPDPPATVSNDRDVEFLRAAYWNGFRMRVDGESTPLLYRGTDARVPAGPAGKDFKFMTKSGWLLEVVPAASGVGSSVVGYAPNGNVYYFDHLVTDIFDTVIHPFKVFLTTNSGSNFSVTTASPETLPRNIYVLYVSRIEDRFGNWVKYEWDGPRLNRIYGNDGREIVIVSEKVVPAALDNPELPDLRYEVKKVSAGTRLWSYDRTPPNSQVTNPGGSKWLYSGVAPGSQSILYQRLMVMPGDNVFEQTTLVSALHDIASCVKAYDFEPDQTRTFSVTHPAGVTASYQFVPTRHGRANMPYACNQPGDDPTAWNTRIPHYEDTWTLTSKTVSGPGIATVSTNYSYSGQDITFDSDAALFVDPSELATGPSDKLVTAARSDGTSQQYVFGRDYNSNEGLLLEQHELNAQQQVVRTTTSTWVAPEENASQAFALGFGGAGTGYSDQFSNFNVPLRSQTISQDGATFRNETNSFDAFVSPVSVTKSSSLGFSRTETTAYHHDLALWVIGQVASVTDLATGKKISETSYDARALPVTFKSFGLLKQTLTYNADGTVATVGDGNGRITTLSGWMRGIPQSIRFADNSTRAAVVDGLGQITSTTDELLTTTTYTYDAMGRLASRSLPGWAPTSFSFVPVATAEFGLPIGHWRHTESTGTYKKSTYFDGRFRPLLTVEEDTANAASKRYTTRAFDHDNRETFASYPEASATSVTGLSQGTRTTYDALGRVTSVSQNDGPSTLLTTRTAYLAGFQTRTTNPNGQSTTVSFQAYDSPDTSAPVSILGPDGVTTTIARDVFGMPLSVTRSGLYAGLPIAATRNYVYDPFERLCKRVDPEAGGTLFEYDGVGNLLGSAEGQSKLLSCDAIPAAARISRSYDARDRLLSVTAPNAPATLYGYAADGALTTLTQGESAWSYGYNNRRLLTNETLSFGDSYAFTYGYNTLGHLTSSSTPGGLSIDTAPNALGQATKAGTFASGAQYFPDGSLKQFSYGNGLIHTVTQNGRHLPLRVRDALGTQVVHDFTYSYDPNGNVTVIDDALNVQDRTLAYDARDRLIAASGVWGVAGYSYDPLDNLRLADQGSRQFRYQYDSNNRLTQLTDPTGTLVTDFAYDTQGRQIRKGTQTRSFDGANRITAINGETYSYDGSGRRIATWAGDGRTKVEVYTQSGQLGFAVDSKKGGGSSFIYLAGQRIAEDHWNCASNTHTVTYYHSDALGSPVATTDAARNVLERTYYAPYGEALNRTVDGPGYTGHVMDAATGLVYAQQRYYDPVVGKFLSIDPVAADPNSGGNFNRYWYANDNPYRFTDPDGRFILNIGAAAIGAVVGGVAGSVVAVVGGGGVKGAIAGFVGGAVGGAITGATLGAGSSAGAIAAAGITGGIIGETSTQLTANIIDNGAEIDAFEFDKTKIAVNGALTLAGAPLGVVVKALSKPIQKGAAALLTPLEQEAIPELAIAPVKLVSGAALDEINKNDIDRTNQEKR